MTREEIKKRIDEALNECLGDIYNELGITSGDIDPFQYLKWEGGLEEVADLFEELIEQNKN